jgi:hypothetical protein
MNCFIAEKTDRQKKRHMPVLKNIALDPRVIFPPLGMEELLFP